MEEEDFLSKATRLCKEFTPIMKLLGRCLALLIVAILSLDYVKATASKDTLSKLDQLFKLGMSI